MVRSLSQRSSICRWWCSCWGAACGNNESEHQPSWNLHTRWQMCHGSWNSERIEPECWFCWDNHPRASEIFQNICQMGPKATDRRAQAAACQSLITRYQKNKMNFWVVLLLVMKHGFIIIHQKASGRQCSGSMCRRQGPRNLRCSHLQAIFWDTQGVVLVDFVPPGHTVSADYYCTLLSDPCGQQSTESDRVCWRKVSFFNMTMHHHIGLVRQ